MQAFVAHLNINPGHLDRFLTHARTSSVPESRKQPGYKATIVLTDPQTDRAIVIGLWEDRQAIVDNGFVAARERITRPLVKDPIVPESWEVSVVDGTF